MNPKHNNPTQLRIGDLWAHAPYNFVPLPEQIVTIKDIPNQDSYSGRSGYIDCKLTTQSPLYTRAAMTAEEFEKIGDKAFHDLTPDQQRERAQFFSLKKDEPLIPGSSLRGMMRALVEIVGFGKVSWVSDALKITYRAVAASRDDPLAEPYRNVLGKFGKNVRAGYLKKNKDSWSIQPAKNPATLGLPESGDYLKVKDRDIPESAIPGFKRFNDSKYTPQYRQVSFDVEIRQGARGKYAAIKQIGTADAGFEYRGVLVCSGNMLETAKPNQRSPRKNYALVLEPNSNAKPIPISDQVVRNYVESLTPFQTEAPFDARFGCLKPDHVVFFVELENSVLWFGHTPNFRVPAVLAQGKRATSPRDFVPDYLRKESDIDLVEAIFGYVSEDRHTGARAGRVFFTDAQFESAADGVWLSTDPITPRVLGSPKPTTFQHYLTQDKSKRHDPDQKAQLANYTTQTPGESVIRGTKLYWNRGAVSADDIREPDQAKIDKAKKQYTQINPVRAGVTFRFRIYFENLTDVELGALLWVLQLPEGHCHKLGMGKPLGMGAVRIAATMHLFDRTTRYQKLLDAGNWFAGDPQNRPASEFIAEFDKYVLQNIAPSERAQAKRLSEVERIRMLLEMLKFPGPDRELTRYMEIEHGTQKVNEYKERPVLPDPLHIAKPTTGSGATHHGRPASPRPTDYRRR